MFAGSGTCLPEVEMYLPEVEMCLPELEMSSPGSGNVVAGSGDVVAMHRKLRVFWKTTIQACGGSFLGLFAKSA